MQMSRDSQQDSPRGEGENSTPVATETSSDWALVQQRTVTPSAARPQHQPRVQDNSPEFPSEMLERIRQQFPNFIETPTQKHACVDWLLRNYTFEKRKHAFQAMKLAFPPALSADRGHLYRSQVGGSTPGGQQRAFAQGPNRTTPGPMESPTSLRITASTESGQRGNRTRGRWQTGRGNSARGRSGHGYMNARSTRGSFRRGHGHAIKAPEIPPQPRFMGSRFMALGIVPTDHVDSDMYNAWREAQGVPGPAAARKLSTSLLMEQIPHDVDQRWAQQDGATKDAQNASDVPGTYHGIQNFLFPDQNMEQDQRHLGDGLTHYHPG
ncbi:hypothetical protein FN846DRAFT_891360 [Sphaerosporella brunnea]|uniref:Uncharacterized protein n=1 Tax=Sphaerosporella brunnea TaxID=1250544 RepID=A0A5J5EUR7_9PEZI|nr:hypothetical protein FN846DRAFT_891360 [Sphaerosporella brunnea]